MFNRLLSSIFLFAAATSSLYAQWGWVDNSNGSSNYSRVEDVAVDSVRDVIYAVGFTDGTPSFAEIPNADFNGQDDGFVMKYDLNGNVEYGFLIGGAGDDRIQGVAVDQVTGNVFVTGFIEGSGVDLDGNLVGSPSVVSTTYGGEDAFVAMYNVFGQLIWYSVFGGTDRDRGMDIAVNSTGVFITGIYTNSGSFATLPAAISINSVVNNVVVALDKTNGNTIWDAVQGSSLDDFTVPTFNFDIARTGITADDNGVYAVNYFYGSSYDIYNASDNLAASVADPNGSTMDFVVTAYSNAGAYNWSALYDNIGSEVNGLDITNDCDGVYVTGALHDASVTPGGTVISSSHDDVIISKLNKANGNEIWVKDFDSGFNHLDYFVGLKADGYGNLYAVGRLRGTSLSSGTDFNYTGGASGSEVMIAHYHTDGGFQNFEVIPSSTYSWGMSIDTYKSEKYVVGGYYNNTITFGSIVPGVAQDNAFVATRTLVPVMEYASSSGGEFSGNPVICQSEVNPIPTINAPLGGTFSGPAQVVFADVNTGEIDLAASTTGGPYTITYSGYPLTCQGSWETTIYIGADGDATFTYADTDFCTNDSNPLPNSIAETGGTFTAQSGLVLANASTGEIDLAASTVGGPYWLVYTTPGLFCADSDSIQITINAVPNANFGYSQTSYCSGTGSEWPSFIVNAGGTFSGPAGLVIDPSTGEINLNTSTPGGPYTIQYVVTGTNCTGTATFDVTIVQSEDASFTYANTTLCANDSNVLPSSITLPGGTFFAPIGLTVANASTGEIEVSTSTPGGPYQLYYTTSGATCPATDSLEFNIVASVDPTFAYAQSTYCSGSGTVLPSIVASPGGTFSGPAGVVFINTTTGEIDLNASTVGGPYSIQYLAGTSPCQTSTTYNLTIAPVEDASFSYASSSFCQNETNPAPSSIATTGGTFSGPAGLVINSSTGQIDLSATTPGGPYTITYTTAGPTCPSSSTFDITIVALDNPTFSYAAASYCQEDGNPSATVSGTPGGFFSGPPQIVFVSTSTGEINLAASTAGGPYSITYTTTGTCPSSSSTNITITPQEDASFTYAASNFCQNEADPVPTLIATPGGMFTSTVGLVFNASTGEIDVSASAPGPYTLNYTTTGTCPSSYSIGISIEDTPDPSFSYAQSTYCQNNANPLPDFIATTGGTFSGSAGISVNPTTGAIDLAGSTSGGPYTIQYLVTNTYCADSATFSVTIDPEDDASFNYATNVFCNNEANPFPSSVTMPGGTFSGSAGLTIDPATGEIDVANSTTGVSHSVFYSTNGPCPVSDVFVLVIEDAPDPSFAYAQSAFCSNEVNPFPSFVATAGGTFASTTGLVIEPNTGEINLSNSTIGTYTIEYIVSNTYCQDTSTFNVTINQSDDASFAYATDHFCNNEANPFPSSITTAGGTFSGEMGLVVNATSGEIDVMSSIVGGPYWLVYATADSTCPAIDSVQIFIENAPDATFEYAQTSFCQGATTTLFPSSVITSGGTFSAPAEVVINASTGEIDLNASTAGGPYTIQHLVTNTYCQKTHTFDLSIVEQDELVSVSYSSNDFCISETSQVPVIVGTSGGTFTGPTSINMVDALTGEINPSSSVPGGPYPIRYVTPGVCPDSIEVLISIFDLVTANAGEDQELFYVFSSTLEGEFPTNSAGVWSTLSSATIVNELDPNSEVTDLQIGTNTFTWTVSNGVCPDASDDMIIEVQDIFIPQAVTPNDDGKNDFFGLHSLDEVTCSLQIFNRWGQLVYENGNYENEWNGQNSKGDALKNDTYFYTILINDSISYNGYIVLKR